MEKKPWYCSRTIWFNIVMLAVATVTQLSTIAPVPIGVVEFVTLVGNVALRFQTIMGIEV